MQPSAAAPQYRSTKTILLIVGVLIVLGLWYNFSKATTPPAATATPSQVIGQHQHLTNPNGSQFVTLFPTSDTLDRAVRATAIGDRTGAAQAEQSASLVPVGASVLVLDTAIVETLNARQIRIESGPFAGQAGWVLANSLAP